MSPNDVWQLALEKLQLQMTRATYDTWLKPTRGLTLDDETLVVGVPSVYVKDWLEQRMHGTLTEVLSEVTGQPLQCAFTVRPVASEDNGRADAQGPAANQRSGFTQGELPSPSTAGTTRPDPKLNARYTFDNFVVGAGNRLAHAAAQAVAEHPAARYNPLFIYGGVGLGKTHLLHAIAHAAIERGANALILSSEKFTNDLINAIRTHSTEEFRSVYRATDMLLIDDIHFIAGKESTQEEFFHTFNAVHGAGGQLVLTSDRPPQAISTLEDRLRSRFQWGLQVDVAPPDLETRIAILRAKADRQGQAVSDPVLELIAQAVQQNVRELEGALNRVLAYASCNQMPLTVETARKALADLMIRRDPPTLPEVIRTVAEYYHLTEDDLSGRSRTARISEPRQVAMYLMREETESSYPTIGATLGGRDHTTILHGCDKIGRLLEQDPKLRRDIMQIREQLYA